MLARIVRMKVARRLVRWVSPGCRDVECGGRRRRNPQHVAAQG